MTKKNNTIILGIESSCDETATALVQKRAGQFKILANTVLSQIKIHRQFGGVVPEVAARSHLENMLGVVNQTLAKAKIQPKQIDKIAVTNGPGLITSLMIGAETAKNLAYAWQKPLIAINHLKAHLYANWLNNQPILFPAIALIVSGGHTEIILLKSKTSFKKIGETVDDAAGEAFDKVAALLNIGYPGGPEVSRLAAKGKADSFRLPRPMMYKDNFNFSFSGLKTAVLYEIKKLPHINNKIKADLCASFQQAAVDVLVFKTIKAAQHYQAKTIILSGGVAANILLRKTLEQKATEHKMHFKVPAINLCTDNAAMIATAGFFKKPIPWQKLRVDPNLKI